MSTTRQPGRWGERIAWLAVVSGGFVVQLLMTVSGIISARLLGVEGRGEVALVVALSATGAALTLGGSLPNVVIKRLADRGVTARDGIGHLASRWSVLAVLCAVPFGIVFVLAHGGLSSSSTWWLGVAVVLLALENMAFRIVTSALLGEGAPMARVALATLLPQTFVTLALVVVLLVTDSATALGVCLVMVGSFALGLVVGVRLLAPRRGGDPLEESDLWRLARSTYVGTLGPIDGLGLDRILVGAVAGTVSLGLYATAGALASLAAMLGSGIAVVLLPRFSAAQAAADGDGRLVRRSLALCVGVLVPIVVVVTVLAEPVIEIAFGPVFLDAVPIAHWLVPAMGLLGLRRVLIAILQGRERGGTASRIEFALTPVMVVGVVLAAGSESATAVAIVLLGVAIASVSLLSIAVWRTTPRTHPPVP
ncbi:lipopolysaccharide biosynthesis protein [Aeromicrobium sp.]|uniref:lipopolysaccharide biosynthesis protein n=1 Tax=Aeromicrobium sp. TaxID=1871063 RepID=UPI004033E090